MKENVPGVDLESIRRCQTGKWKYLKLKTGTQRNVGFKIKRSPSKKR